MGMQDRDWYRDAHKERRLEEQRRAQSWYNPKLFRRSVSDDTPPPLNVVRSIGLCVLICFAVYGALSLIRWAQG